MSSVRLTRMKYFAVILIFVLDCVWYWTYHLPYFHSIIDCYINTVILIALSVYWLAVLQRRVLDDTCRRLMLFLALIILMWMVLREFKYQMNLDDQTLSRYLWYASYIPQMIIPLIFFYISLVIGREQRGILRSPWILLVIPAVILIMLVMTNDFHMLAFRYRLEDAAAADAIHTYGPVYYAVFAWEAAVTLGALGILIYQSSISAVRRRSWLPITAFIITGLLSVSVQIFSHHFFGFMEMLSFSYALTLESCIQIGLIPSNTGYESLYRSLSVQCELLDQDGVRHLATDGYDSARANESEFAIRRETAVRGGTFRYLVETGELQRLNDQLEDVRKQLSDESSLLQAENELREREARVGEVQRLYSTLLDRMQPALSDMEHLLPDDPDAPDFLRQLAIVCVDMSFVKRQENLLLLRMQEDQIPDPELYNCVREVTDYMRLCGIHVSLTNRLGDYSGRDELAALFECFRQVVRALLQRMSFAVITLRSDPGSISMRLMLRLQEGDTLAALMPAELMTDPRISAEEGDGTAFLTLHVVRGGDKP